MCKQNVSSSILARIWLPCPFQRRRPDGTTVTLRFAEVLNPEGLSTLPISAPRELPTITLSKGGRRNLESKFTFHGFRYVELVNYPGPVTRDTISGIVLHSEMAQTGYFECSEPLLNQLQSNIVWGKKVTLWTSPPTAPARRALGWAGDIQVFARTAAFNFDVAAFLTRWMQDVADAQTEDGSIRPSCPA